MKFFAAGFAAYLFILHLAQGIYSHAGVSECNASTIDWQNSSRGVLQNRWSVLSIKFLPAFSIPTKAKSMRRSGARSRTPLFSATTTWGPTNIKIMVNGDTAKVTGLLDWELAGYLPKGWISTKLVCCRWLAF